MSEKKKAETTRPEPSKEKPAPRFLRPDYPFQAIGDAITDLDSLESGVVYEIKCHQCEMSIRSQGQTIKSTCERLMAGNGCIGCGSKDLVIKRVDMSKDPATTAADSATGRKYPA